MIEDKTVFVLGAGAHVPYGFPSGKRLKVLAADRLASAGEGSTNGFHLLDLSNPYFAPQYAAALAGVLRRAGQPSIDAFLDSRKGDPNVQALGKAAIAQILLEYEASADVGGEYDDDWLGYLFEQMLVGVSRVDDFVKRNDVSFITFNYDRFLETWLHSRIQHSFALDPESALGVLGQFKIHHAYGSLGPYPVPGGTRNRAPWGEASKGIKLIFEATQRGDPDVDSARKLLRDADVICILGFGFHKENIDLLELNVSAHRSEGRVIASRHGFTGTEWGRVLRLFTPETKILVPDDDCQCRATLRNTPVF